jgi:hypothetical protein
VKSIDSSRCAPSLHEAPPGCHDRFQAFWPIPKARRRLHWLTSSAPTPRCTSRPDPIRVISSPKSVDRRTAGKGILRILWSCYLATKASRLPAIWQGGETVPCLEICTKATLLEESACSCCSGLCVFFNSSR